MRDLRADEAVVALDVKPVPEANASIAPDPPSQIDAAAAPVEPLAHSAGRGATTLSVASLAMRGLNLAGQIVLGAVLPREDFGLFAISTSVAAFVVVLQDGGLRTLIVQRGEEEYERLEGPAFWLGMIFNLAAALLLATAAPLAASLYRQPKLTLMLWVTSSAILLNSLGSIPLSVLRMRMRFGALSMIEVLGGIVRYGGMIAGALAGLGPLSFVAPLPVIGLLEASVGFLLTRRTPWRRPPETDRWRGLLASSTWLVASAVAGSALYLGSHMALGLSASTELVGVYFFGYALVWQSGYLIISTAERVLLPVLSRLRSEPDRQRLAVLRTLRAVSVLAFSACALIGALYPGAENLIWRGKWAVATPVVQIVALCYPIFTLHVIARCVITAWGRFRAHAISVALAGAALMLTAWASGMVTQDVATVGWITGVAMVITSFTYLAWGTRDLRIGVRQLVAEIGPVALIGAVALAIGMIIDRLVLRGIGPGLDPVAEAFETRLVADGMRLVAAGIGTAIVLVVGFRFAAASGLRECLQVLPERWGRIPRRWLDL